jgi:hypothetical protein
MLGSVARPACSCKLHDNWHPSTGCMVGSVARLFLQADGISACQLLYHMSLQFRNLHLAQLLLYSWTFQLGQPCPSTHAKRYVCSPAAAKLQVPSGSTKSSSIHVQSMQQQAIRLSAQLSATSVHLLLLSCRFHLGLPLRQASLSRPCSSQLSGYLPNPALRLRTCCCNAENSICVHQICVHRIVNHGTAMQRKDQALSAQPPI